MSDCGIHGNKNWQRAVDKASDKPAATVTGSGETTCPKCGRTTCEGTHMSTTSAVVPPTWATPPASPAVTLDRAVYDMVTTALTSLEGLLELNNACNAAHQVRDLLALLRAAERQK